MRRERDSSCHQRRFVINLNIRLGCVQFLIRCDVVEIVECANGEVSARSERNFIDERRCRGDGESENRMLLSHKRWIATNKVNAGGKKVIACHRNECVGMGQNSVHQQSVRAVDGTNMWKQYATTVPNYSDRLAHRCAIAHICDRRNVSRIRRAETMLPHCSFGYGGILRLQNAYESHTYAMRCRTVDALRNAAKWAHISFSSITAVQYSSASCTWNAFFFSRTFFCFQFIFVMFKFRNMFCWSIHCNISEPIHHWLRFYVCCCHFESSNEITNKWCTTHCQWWFEYILMERSDIIMT